MATARSDRTAGPPAAADHAGQAPAAGVGIGPQLRAARLAARKSMAEVAEQSGLTKGFVSKLERDLANVSVASLIRLCAALDISAGSLFQPSRGEVIRRDAYPPINFGGSGVREYLLTPSGEKRMQAILSDIEPGGGSGAEPYSLPADVEFVFVLAGQLEITVAGQLVALDRGTRSRSRAVPGTPSGSRPEPAGPGALGVLPGAAGHSVLARLTGARSARPSTE